jgi:predicted GNAT family N-acyltransferase
VTEVRPARTPPELWAALALRRAVFVDEQGVPLDEELDGRDDEAFHLVAVEPDGAVVGTCRLLRDAATVTLGRMAVAPPARGRGLAGELLAEAEREAREAGATHMRLAAQVDAVGLYDRAGYEPVGERFLDAGLEHQTMQKRLDG